MTLNKKILAAFLAAAMAASMSAPAFAERNNGDGATGETIGDDVVDLTTSPTTNQGAGNYALNVNGKFQAGSAAKDTISVDITWETMSFTYTQGEASYSAETHQTTYGTGSWSEDKPKISITNHSNTEVTAAFTFAAADGVTTTGTFYTKSGDNYTKIENVADQKLTLDSAEGKATTAAPQGALYFGVSGAEISEDAKLGTITVKIAGPQWTVVNKEDDLYDALLAGGYVRLGDNFTATLDLTPNDDSEISAKLDLNGKTLTGSLTVGNKFNLTVLDKVGGGKITYADGNTINVLNGSFTLESSTINCDDLSTHAIDAFWCSVTINGGTVNGDGTAIQAGTNSNVTINGGKVAGSTSDTRWAGIDVNTNSKLTVTGGEITGRRAIYVSDGITNISGGIITGKNTDTDGGSAFALEQRGDTGTLTISGGTFSAVGGGQYAEMSNYSVYANTETTITGGTFKQSIVNYNKMTISDCTMTGYSIGNQVNNGDATLTINGGTYTLTSINNDAIGEDGLKATLNITGGTFTLSDEILNHQDGTRTAEINISGNGAKITAAGITNKGTITVSDGVTLSISGGIANEGSLTLEEGVYSFDPTNYVAANNYTVSQTQNGYEVKKK